MTTRRRFAVANWKMEMAIAEALADLDLFGAKAGDLLHRVDVVLCPPFTALYAMAQHLQAAPLPVGLGVQTVSAAAGGAHTGEISACLAADAGARWTLLGHWELRRHLGDTDEIVNQKLHPVICHLFLSRATFVR